MCVEDFALTRKAVAFEYRQFVFVLPVLQFNTLDGVIFLLNLEE